MSWDEQFPWRNNVVVFGHRYRRGRPNPLKFGIALSASAPSRVDNHLNELCNLIAREIA
jgi:hypothetical protein